ncbi:MAG: hypothetical protein WBW16_11785 [Bacteroidota bacterium]
MNVKKLLLAALVVGVVANVLDFIVHGQILAGAFYSKLTSLFRQDMSMVWPIIGDFVWALVFVWVYNRVYSSFSGGAKGGATYGLYVGILFNFPANLFMNVMFVGFPYGLAWIWVIWGIIAAVINGAVAGAIYKKEKAPAIA